MAKTPRRYQEKACHEILEHCFNCWKTGKIENILLEASVGAGKTLIMAVIAKFINDKIEKQLTNAKRSGNDEAISKLKNVKILALADQAELISQNSQEGWDFGLRNSVFSAQLGSKSTLYRVIYGSRQTLTAIDRDGVCTLDKDFKDCAPSILLVDEVHKWDFENEESQAGKLFLHFKKNNPNLIVIGVTGTPYRGVEHIVGEGRFFEVQTKNTISTTYLINEGFLVDRIYGMPKSGDDIDFSSITMRDNNETGGNYSEDEINEIYQGEADTTFRICAEIAHNTSAPEEMGVLIFCGSKFHTTQVKYGLEMSGVDPKCIAIVTDETTDSDREKARLGAIKGKIKYFINVAIASTGWNVPRWKHLVFMRPVGSIVFFEQSCGRPARPYLADKQSSVFNSIETTASERKTILAASDKPISVIHDYAGVIEKLAPYLENDFAAVKAIEEKAAREFNTKPCPKCNHENGEFAQRCSNIIDENRCIHFFHFVECLDKKCRDEEGNLTKNSPMSQGCRICGKILKDPNKALYGKSYSDSEYREVSKMSLELSRNGGGVIVRYQLSEPDEMLGVPWVYFHLDKKEYNRANWFNNFVIPHYRKDKSEQLKIRGVSAKTAVSLTSLFDTPKYITVRKNDDGKYLIAKKKFRSGREEVA